MKYAVEIAYSGLPFHGWQRQENANSVQQTIEEAMIPLLDTPAKIHGCGRTDTGVHANQYFFHFEGELKKTKKWIYSLNQILPESIACKNIFIVPDDFHARFDAKSRSYTYFIRTFKDPFNSQKSWYFHGNLNMDLMNQACEILKSHSDFGSFCKSKSQNKTNICHIENAEWLKVDSTIRFDITADRFLRNMVRAIVGTMLEVGLEKINLDEFNDVIEAKDRKKAGFSVPAQGLFLQSVVYDQSDWELIRQEH